MPAPQKSQDAARANALAVIGVVLALVGGFGARMGTTNGGLFVLYLLLFFGGIGLVGASQRIRNRKYER